MCSLTHVESSMRLLSFNMQGGLKTQNSLIMQIGSSILNGTDISSGI